MLKKITKRARPIPDLEIFKFVNKNVKSKYIYEKKLHTNFLIKYFQWLQKSSLNRLNGLNLFNKLSFVHGTSQAFDDFYSTHRGRRFRVFKGEFKYHQIIWRENKIKWTYIEKESIKKK